MKTLILNPVSLQTKNVVRDVLYGCWCNGKRIGGGTVPPFALLEVATILKNDGNDVVFMDAQAEQKCFSQINDVSKLMDLVIISTSTMSFIEDANLLQKLKIENPRLTTVVFGSHPTFMPQYTLAHPGVDIAVFHEPEYILLDLLRVMRLEDDWKQVKGIGYKENGVQKINTKYDLIKHLDDLPYPDVTLLPKGIDYFNPIVRRMPYMTTTTSRGCVGKCTFCPAPRFDGLNVRYQSAAYVVGEVEYLLAHGYREVYFRDDTFFVNKKRDVEICRQIIDRKLDVSWIANARINMIDKETMMLARQAGCHTIKFGVESGVQEILDRVHKGYRLDQAYDVFRWAKEAKLNTHAHVMLGMPGDNLETIDRTIKFVLELDPTTATFGICTPYPGTSLFDEVSEVYPEIQDGTSSDLGRLHINGLFNEQFTSLKREELEKSVQRAYRRFYLRPSYLFKSLKNQLHGVDDIKRISLAATNVLDFSIFGG